MAGLQDAILNGFVREMEQEAAGREVWAFIATYDEHGQFAWKAYAEGDDYDDVMLGSEKVTFASVKDVD